MHISFYVLRPCIFLTIIFTFLLGAAYPLGITAILQGVFKEKANGSLIIGNDGKIYGSKFIGQYFDEDKYFWARLSYTEKFPYNAMASGASNLSAANPLLIENAKKVKDKLKLEQPVPIDLVTSSASGLDPHISPAAAKIQIARVAKARNEDPATIEALVKTYTENRQFGILGEIGVNVLKLNLALDGKI